MEIIAVTHAGMSTEAFLALVKPVARYGQSPAF